MIFEQAAPSNEPVITMAVVSSDASATELQIDYATEGCARITHVSADEDGLFAYSEEGHVIRDGSLISKETIDEILSLGKVTAKGFDRDNAIVFNNLELEIVQPAPTSAPGM
jgi:hypothetical protein